VRDARWLEDVSKWKVDVEDLSTGAVITDYCDIIVNATGFLNRWKWPKIDGIETFSRPKIHSAAWDHSIELEDKVIGVIGSGSSAIQVCNLLVSVTR
jgi:cation diffusion facilitator CzcD-associated flavoprotein CzcO